MKKKLFGGIVALIMALVNTLRALSKREHVAYVIIRRLCDDIGEFETEYPVRVFRTEKRAMEYMRKNYAAYTVEDIRDHPFYTNGLCRWDSPGEAHEYQEYVYKYEWYTLFQVPV